MSIKNSIFRALKGAAIGVAIIIPGISGGTVAVLLEIYEEMIKAISSLRKEFKKSVDIRLKMTYTIGVANKGRINPV